MKKPMITIRENACVVTVAIPHGWKVEVIEPDMEYIKRKYYRKEIDKIGAIKEVRCITGLGLREAKGMVDDWDKE